jgi:hypothetical protein
LITKPVQLAAHLNVERIRSRSGWDWRSRSRRGRCAGDQHTARSSQGHHCQRHDHVFQEPGATHRFPSRSSDPRGTASVHASLPLEGSAIQLPISRLASARTGGLAATGPHPGPGAPCSFDQRGTETPRVRLHALQSWDERSPPDRVDARKPSRTAQELPRLRTTDSDRSECACRRAQRRPPRHVSAVPNRQCVGPTSPRTRVPPNAPDLALRSGVWRLLTVSQDCREALGSEAADHSRGLRGASRRGRGRWHHTGPRGIPHHH